MVFFGNVTDTIFPKESIVQKIIDFVIFPVCPQTFVVYSVVSQLYIAFHTLYFTLLCFLLLLPVGYK
jgi:hypothetical protein